MASSKKITAQAALKVFHGSLSDMQKDITHKKRAIFMLADRLERDRQERKIKVLKAFKALKKKA